MSKEAYYFSHDANARRDPKILAMRNEFGSEGYGWYWILVEMLSEQENYKLKHTKWVTNAIAMEMLCETNTAEKFVNSCIQDYELFVSDGEYFWSESLLRRMNIKEEKRKKKVEAGKKGAEKRWKSNTDIANERQSDSTAITKHSKGKESKVKEIKENKSKTNLLNDDGTKDIIQSLIENEMVKPGGITKTLSDDLDEIFEKFQFDNTKEVVLEAIKISARGNGRTWRFVFNKLDLWRKQGVKTVTDATNFENQSFPNRRSSKPIRTEYVPEWVGKETNESAAVTTDPDFEEKKRIFEERLKKNAT